MAEPGPGISPRRVALVAIAALALVVPASGANAASSSAARAAAAAKALLAASKAAAARTAATSAGGHASRAPAQPVRTARAPARHKAPAAPRAPLAGWLGNGTTAPQRAVVLYPPTRAALKASQIHVTENGATVTGVTLAPMSAPAPGDIGVIFVIDQSSSMAGAPLATAIHAARSFAAQRAAQQQLGVVMFNSSASVLLHPTGDAKSIDSGLAAMPSTAPGANVAAGTTLALSELAQAKLALGAIIVISDGAGKLVSPSGPATATATAAAAAARVPVFTIGLRDAASSPATMGALRAASPGQFISANATQLPTALHTIYATLTRGYVLRYASRQPAGHHVSATVTATGVPGAVDIGYQAPVVSAVASTPRNHAPAPIVVPPPAKQGGPDFSHTTLLSPTPSFASAPVSRPAPAPPATSFWASSSSIPILAGISGLLIAAALMLAFRRPARRGVRIRVGNFIPGPEDSEFDDLVPISTRRKPGASLFRARWWVPFVQDVAVARSAHTPVALLKRAAAAGLVLAVLVTVVSGTLILGLAPLLLWPFPLRALMKRGARKQRELFVDTLPGYLQDLASAMRVGRSFASSLAIVAATADEPVRSELERAVTDEALGRPIDESLQAVGVRMQANDIEQVALIAALNRRSGSNVAEALDRVAEGARDRADLRREIKALTGQAKMSSWVLTALPPLLLVGISFVSPLYAHPLFHTTYGIVALALGAVMVFAGWKVMQKITTIKA